MCAIFDEKLYVYQCVKTFFLHLSDKPDIDPIVLDEKTVINPGFHNKYVYLGMKFVASNDIIKHKRNLKDRMFHVSKFSDWFHVNETTPVKVKLQVLYTCMFNAYLYGAETWWKIDDVSKQLLMLPCYPAYRHTHYRHICAFIEYGTCAYIREKNLRFFHRFL